MRYLLGALAFALLALPGAGRATEMGPSVAALSPDDVANVIRVEQYLNRIDTIQARFVQISSNGNFAEGEVFVSRPGNLRFDYDPPAMALLIANVALSATRRTLAFSVAPAHATMPKGAGMRPALALLVVLVGLNLFELGIDDAIISAAGLLSTLARLTLRLFVGLLRERG